MKELTEDQQISCLKCGTHRHTQGSFCAQCGSPSAPPPDKRSVSVFAGMRASVPNQASDNDDPEKMWWEGLDANHKARVLELEGRCDESRELMDRAMNLWTHALELGVKGKSEVTCHWFIGNEFYDRGIDLEEHHGLLNEALGQTSTLSKGVSHLEKAVELDVQIDNFVFGNKENQADLLKLDVVWGSQALYIKNKYGIEPATSYIIEKIKLTQHLLVVLPSLFYSFGYVYADAGSIANAMDMFRAAINAEDYGDVIGHEDWRYRVAQIAKRNAANNLKYLEVYGRSP